MKIILIAAILITSTMTSLTYIKQIKNHSKAVMQIVLLIENIRILIKYKNLSIEEIMKSISASDNYNLLTFLEILKSGLSDYPDTLKEVFADKSINNCFDNDDIEHIVGFFSMLGASDVDGQIANCDFYKKLFEKKYSELSNNEASKCKCTSALSISAGLLISIILI